MNEIKLIIADDHELFRNGLTELLKKHDDIDVVKSVGDGLQFIEELKSNPDIARSDAGCSVFVFQEF